MRPADACLEKFAGVFLNTVKRKVCMPVYDAVSAHGIRHKAIRTSEEPAQSRFTFAFGICNR